MVHSIHDNLAIVGLLNGLTEYFAAFWTFVVFSPWKVVLLYLPTGKIWRCCPRGLWLFSSYVHTPQTQVKCNYLIAHATAALPRHSGPRNSDRSHYPCRAENIWTRQGRYHLEIESNHNTSWSSREFHWDMSPYIFKTCLSFWIMVWRPFGAKPWTNAIMAEIDVALLRRQA